MRHPDAEWRMVRDTAETVVCPHCEAAEEQHCRNVATGDELRSPAHPARITASEDTS